MSNTKEYTPVSGSFTLAARRTGKTKQYISQCWKAGKPLPIITAVIKASIEIVNLKNEERRKYAEMMRKAAQLADEVNGLIK